MRIFKPTPSKILIEEVGKYLKEGLIMNKTIKVIDLLNKIANGEEVPKKIKFCFRTFEYNGISDYLCIDKNDYSKEDYCNGYSIHKWIFGNNLNDEVEIIEEEPQEHKIPEKFEIYDNSIEWCCNGRSITDNEKDIMDKINEILDYLEVKND